MPQDQKDKVNVAREKKKKRNKGKNPHQVSHMKSLISEVASPKRTIAASASAENQKKVLRKRLLPTMPVSSLGDASRR